MSTQSIKGAPATRRGSRSAAAPRARREQRPRIDAKAQRVRPRLGTRWGADQIEAELVRSAALDLEALRSEWLRLTGTPAPRALRRDLFMRALAERIQTAVFGGLSSGAARFLDRLAVAEDPSVALRSQQSRRLKPGMLLVREHAGVLQRVTVLNEGYAWNGAIYRACPRWREPSSARAGTGHASSA